MVEWLQDLHEREDIGSIPVIIVGIIFIIIIILDLLGYI